MNIRLIGLFIIVSFLLDTGVFAQSNWPQFRGELGGVALDDPALPDTWGPTENIVWAVDIPGRSWSSPIVWNDHIFVTTVFNTTSVDEPMRPVGDYRSSSLGGSMTGRDIVESSGVLQWVLYDFDFDSGRLRWQQVLHTMTPTESTHQKNSYASETPVTDGERVYVYIGDIGLFAVNVTGELAWSTLMESVPRHGGWGSGSSPVINNGRLYLVNDNEKQSFVAGYDTVTGNELWRTNRDERTNWATPFVWKNNLRTEIVTTGAGGVRSYSLDGVLLWELFGMSTYVIPTPFAKHGLLYINSGYTRDSVRPVYAISPGARGDISLRKNNTYNDYVVWSNSTLGSYNPSSLVYGDYHYTLLDRGFLICYDARTGQQIYPRKRITAGTIFTASPWAYNGKIFALSEDGDTFVIQAGPEFELIGRNTLNEMTLASPAVANKSLILRTVSKLYRISRDSGS